MDIRTRCFFTALQEDVVICAATFDEVAQIVRIVDEVRISLVNDTFN
jgi:hypothetical protein